MKYYRLCLGIRAKSMKQFGLLSAAGMISSEPAINNMVLRNKEPIAISSWGVGRI
jgi:hypothetical protein